MHDGPQEWERAYTLAKARCMSDAALAIEKTPSAAGARTPEEVQCKRMEAAPLCLRGRVEGGEALPEVGVEEARTEEQGRGEGGCEKEEELREVARFALEALKAELFVEYMQWMRIV